MSLLTVDPGADAGLAWFEQGRLRSCALASPALIDPAYVKRVVIECPRVYPKIKADPNDLIRLARRVGEVEAMFRHADIRIVFPRDWKGTVPKDIFARRIIGRLDACEREIYDDACQSIAAGKRHNVADAIGLGLFDLGRMGH